MRLFTYALTLATSIAFLSHESTACMPNAILAVNKKKNKGLFVVLKIKVKIWTLAIVLLT